MKNRACYCVILFATWFMNSDRALAAEDIILRAAVTPEKAWVGQKVVLHVDVLAKNGWAQLKKVGNTEVDGAYLLRLETQGTRLSEMIDGDSYTGQRYEFMLFAQRDGKLTVSPAPVDVEVKAWGTGGGTLVERMMLPAAEFVARTPPGAEGLRGLISTSDLSARQKWEPETDSLQIGDALKRSITLRADDVSGMAFVPLRHKKIEHLGIYPGEPVVEDRFARGNLTGTRVETVTYVVEHAGEIEIPDIEFSWWDVGASELKHVVLPGLSLFVTASTANESIPAEIFVQPRSSQLLWPLLLVIVVAAVVVLRFRKRIVGRYSGWPRARQAKEVRYFRRAIRSIRSGHGKAALRDTMRWLDRINTTSRPARLDQFLGKYGDAKSQAAGFDLTGMLGTERDDWDVAAMIRGLRHARKRWRNVQRGCARVSKLLPELNG